MSQVHNWVAVFSINLTDKEAAQAYTFDIHGRRVIASRLNDDARRPIDGVVVGCYDCELAYSEALGKPCIPDDTLKNSI